MSILIEDSPRNLLRWIEEAISAGTVDGVVLDPFCSPANNGYPRRTAREVASRVHELRSRLFFDAATHLQGLPGAGDFRYYDQYDLWAGPRGDLSGGGIRDHTARVLSWQRNLAAKPLGPTVLVRSPLAPEATTAVSMARETMTQAPDAWVTIAGDESFWATGAQLDAHIGAIAQFQPRGYFLCVVRTGSVLPPLSTRQEVSGLARTVRSLKTVPVHISHGDLAALPGIAAGAHSVGSGWDQRQMLIGEAHYGPRSSGDNGGGWYERPTIAEILSRIKKPEYESLVQRAPNLATRVVPGRINPLGPKNIFHHHLRVLSQAIVNLKAIPDDRARFDELARMYSTARAQWPLVKAAAIAGQDATAWIDELAAGLSDYARDEGW